MHLYMGSCTGAHSGLCAGLYTALYTHGISTNGTTLPSVGEYWVRHNKVPRGEN